jgi:hypothetical protein
MPLCSPNLNICGRNSKSTAGSEITRNFARHSFNPKDRAGVSGDNGQNGALQSICSKAVRHAHNPRRQLRLGHRRRTYSAAYLIPPTKRHAAADQRRRRGARWDHRVAANLNCAITPVSYQATDGSKDLAALGERSTMNTLQRILAYLFRAKPMGPLVIGWSYQNGQRAVFRLPH